MAVVFHVSCAMERVGRYPLLALLALLGLSAAASAEQLVLGAGNPSEHTAMASTDNGGATWSVSVDSIPWSSGARPTNAQNESRLLIEFEPTGLAGPVRVHSATLSYNVASRFYKTNPETAAVNFEFYGYGDADGACTAADFRKIDTPVGFGELIYSTGRHDQAIDASFVESVINAGGQLGFVFRSAVVSDYSDYLGLIGMGASSTFDSRKPVLTIDYTVIPEPTTIGLMALGAVAALRRRRR